MTKKIELCLLILPLGLWNFVSTEYRDNKDSAIRNFPPGFLWGVGSSSHQIEGGWNADDKGESIWDYLDHNRADRIVDHSNGDVTADSYHLWRRDVEMLRQLHVGTYRFSLSWARILPGGYSNYVSQAGLNYYSNLIDELLRYNITPMATIYHWELPQRLQELGGWTNPEIVPLFKDYAELLFTHFGERVKLWTTINEPWHMCEFAYGVDYMAPAYDFPGIPSYLCGHNTLKAHAEAVHLYREKFQSSQKGRIGFTVGSLWPEPRTNSEADRAASERAMQFYIGWFAHPIFSEHGNYPPVMIERIGKLSMEQNFTRSRLPKFTSEEIHRIRGTSDFLGINSYTSKLVQFNDDKTNPGKFPVPSFSHDMGVTDEADPNWPGSGSIWLKVVPEGMYNILMWLHREYPNLPIIVTENGVSDRGGLNDQPRVDYLNEYLSAIADAIDDGANVQGYIVWSLMDSYEWKVGFTEKFGLYHVDFNHPERKRTPKLSAYVYAQICKTNSLNVDYKPENFKDFEKKMVPSARHTATRSAKEKNCGTSYGASFSLCALFAISLLKLNNFVY